MTDRRVLFTGTKSTREWVYSKLLGTVEIKGGYLMHVSNRQKVSGVLLGGSSLEFFKSLLMARLIHDRGARALAEETAKALAAHDSARPQTPDSFPSHADTQESVEDAYRGLGDRLLRAMDDVTNEESARAFATNAALDVIATQRATLGFERVDFYGSSAVSGGGFNRIG